ncbi:MAG: hypothetical protein HW410_1593, partial [Nitrosarchaeum sp.]|nr:hypothetical protein [Nitrosarchaeum sp.]
MLIAKFIIMKTTIATITTILLVGSITPFVNAEGVPSWIKNNAGWWADGTISESEFIQGIQFLIKDGIIVIPPTAVSAEISQSVPAWVKNNAGWWADGTITDTEFINGIQHLIKTGVISISDSKSSDSVPKTISNDSSTLASLQAELEKCSEIVKPYPRLNCERDTKLKITEYGHQQNSAKYVVGDVTFYFPGPDYKVTPSGQALLTINMLVKNTGSSEIVTLMCTGPSICNYDVWNGEKAFKYSATDFTSGTITLKSGQAREFS